MKTFRICLAAGCLVALYASPAQAALVAWNVDPVLSQLRLAIPDQTLDLDGNTATIRARNQTGATTSWTVGNLANVSGTFLTNYQDGLAPSVEFLSGGVGDLVGINSGSYRPDLDSYTGGTVNPNGSASGGFFDGTGGAPAVYGGRLRPTVLGITTDAGFFSFNDLSYSLASGPLSVNSGTGEFSANSVDFGVLGGLIGVDVISPLLLGFWPDTILAIPNLLSDNTAALGTITSPDPINQPLLRQLSLPLLVPIEIDFGGTVLQASFSGSIVAFATVPEPATGAQFCFGLGSLVCLAVRARRRSR